MKALQILIAVNTLALTSLQCAPAPDSGLLLIPVDRLNPVYVIAADKYNLKIPNLRRLAVQFYALGVDGIFTDLPDTAVAARRAVEVQAF